MLQLLSGDNRWHSALHREPHLGCALARTIISLHDSPSLRTAAEHVIQLMATRGSTTTKSPVDSLIRDFRRRRSRSRSRGSGDADVAPPSEDSAVFVGETTSIEQSELLTSVVMMLCSDIYQTVYSSSSSF